MRTDPPPPKHGPSDPVAAGVLLALTLAATWPWAAGPPRSTTQPDAAFTALNLQHIQRWLMGDVTSLWNTRLARPLHDTLTATDWVLGEAVLGLPAYLVGLSPMVVHHSVAVLGIWLTAVACHAVAVGLTGRGWHTLVAGVVGGLGPTMLAHAHHVNLVQRYLVIGGATLLALGVLRRSSAVAAAGGVVAGLAFHFGLYCGLHASLAFALTAAVAAHATSDRRRVLWGVGGWAAVTATSVPIYLHYARVVASNPTEMAGARLGHDVLDLLAPIRPLDGPLLHAPFAWAWRGVGLDQPPTFDPANPGLVAWALILLGLVSLRRGEGQGPRWLWGALLALALAGVALAAGPSLHIGSLDTWIPGPYAIVVRIPGLVALRDPSRWFELTTLAAAPVAALGARRALLWARSSRSRGAVLALGAVVLVLECMPTELGRGAIHPHPIYAALAKVEPGRVVDSALTQRVMTCGCGRNMALNAALEHEHELVGGRYARMTRREVELGRLIEHWPKPDARELFASAGVDRLVVHPGDPSPPKGLACQQVGSGSVAHHLCQLEPRRDVTTWPANELVIVRDGPVDGVRVPYVPMRRGAALDALELRCGDGPPTRYRLAVWSLLTAIRTGQGAPPWVDVVLEERCAEGVLADREVILLRRAVP